MLENDYLDTINKDSNIQFNNDVNSVSENESVKSEQNSKIKEGGYENIEYQCLDDDNFVECFEDEGESMGICTEHDNKENNGNKENNANNVGNNVENINDLPEQKVLEEFV